MAEPGDATLEPLGVASELVGAGPPWRTGPAGAREARKQVAYLLCSFPSGLGSSSSAAAAARQPVSSG